MKGLCAGRFPDLTCFATAGATVDSLILRLKNGTSPQFALPAGQVGPLFSEALYFQSKILLCLLAAGGVIFFIGLLYVTLLKRHLKSKPNATAMKRRNFYKRLANVMIWSSAALALASTIALTEVTAALQHITTADTGLTVRITSGAALPILQWLIFSFSITFAFGVSTIFKTQDGTVQSAGSAPSCGSSFGGPPPPPPPPPPPGY